MADQFVTPLKTNTSNEASIPPIAAVFLVNFDHRKGCACSISITDAH